MEITAKGCIRSAGKIYKSLSSSFILLILHASYIILIKNTHNSRSDCRIIEWVYIKFGTEGGDGQHKY